jgi:hypothetical protein
MGAAQKIIYETDFYNFLQRNGGLDRIAKGKLICFVCRTVISDWRTISRVTKHGGILDYVCDRPDCVYQAAKKAAG